MEDRLTVAAVLRAVREQANLTQADVAQRVGVSQSTYSGWETGTLPIPVERIAPLDSATEAKGEFADLATAILASDEAEPPRAWQKNFAGPPRPCWAWLRPTHAGIVRATATWGPFTVTIDQPVDAGGLFLLSPTLVANPPVRIDLRVPGRVDYGVGDLPHRLKLSAVDATSLVDAHPIQRWWLDRAPGALPPWAEALLLAGTRIGLRREVIRPYLGSLLPLRGDVERVALAGADVGRRALLSGAQWRAIREARGHSRQTLAVTATRAIRAGGGTETVTSKHIETLEAQGLPRDLWVLPALDLALDQDGASFVQESSASFSIRAGRALWRIEFTRWWVGPVWLRLLYTGGFGQDGPLPLAEIELLWTVWRKRLAVEHGTVVSCRRATRDAKPLLVLAPLGWEVLAGMGSPPATADVNAGWRPADLTALATIIRDSLRLFYMQFVRSLGGGCDQPVAVEHR